MICPNCGFSPHDDILCHDCGFPNAQCICQETDDDTIHDNNECEECGQKYGYHHFRCSHDISAFGDLIRNGFD